MEWKEGERGRGCQNARMSSLKCFLRRKKEEEETNSPDLAQDSLQMHSPSLNLLKLSTGNISSSDNAGQPESVTAIVILTGRACTELIAGESHLSRRRQTGLTPWRQIVKCLWTGSPSSIKPRELSISGIGIGGQLGVTIVILNEAAWPYFMNVEEDRPIDSPIN